MNKKTPSEQESAMLAVEQQSYRRSLRRRFIGTLAVFTLTFSLWKVGGELPPDLAAAETPPAAPAAIKKGADNAISWLKENKHNEWLPEWLWSSDAAQEPQVPPGPTAIIVPRPDEDNVASDGESTVLATATVTTALNASAKEETPAPAPPAKREQPLEKSNDPTPATKTAKAQKTQATPNNRIAPQQASKAQSGENFIVQIGAFNEHSRANTIVKSISRNGFIATINLLKTNGKTLHRVQIGGYTSRPAAEKAQAALSKIGYKDTRVFNAAKLNTPPPVEAKTEKEKAAKAKAAQDAAAQAAARQKAKAEKEKAAKAKAAQDAAAQAAARQKAKEKAEKEKAAKAKAAQDAAAQAARDAARRKAAQTAAEKAARAQAAREAAAAAKAKEEAKTYTLEVGVFREHNRVNQAITEVRKAGVAPKVQPVDRNGVRKFRVYAVDIRPRAEAERLQQVLQEAGFNDVIIE